MPTNDTVKAYVSSIIQHTQVSQSQLEYAINLTPTGEARNHLTDANMHLMMAERALGEAAKA